VPNGFAWRAEQAPQEIVFQPKDAVHPNFIELR
jgi:hypothetical protein